MTPSAARHVVLVGLMGVGKTTVGRRLAKELERPFADTDEQVELRAGRTVPRIFAGDGEATFRQLEREVLGELLATPHPLVIAAGGGVVVAPENRTALAAHAFVVWLHADPSFLVGRVDTSTRPLLQGAGGNEALQRIYDEREAIYREVADAVFDVQPAYESGADKPKRVVASALADLVRSREFVP